MTREEKIKWLENATNEEVINQFKWTVTALTIGSLDQRIEAEEDYDLVTKEILNRMNLFDEINKIIN